jgi:hypothetical protein
MPATETKIAELLEKANTLPALPGVYLMRDRSGKIIYVGKAKRLKFRVTQYFQNNRKDLKTSKLVKNRGLRLFCLQDGNRGADARKPPLSSSTARNITSD